MMDGLNLFLSDPRSAALAVNLGIPSVLILGAAWLFMKAAAPRSAALRRGVFLAALLCATLAPAAGIALHRCGVYWTLSPIGLDGDGAPSLKSLAGSEKPIGADREVPPLFPDEPGSAPEGAFLPRPLEAGTDAAGPTAMKARQAKVPEPPASGVGAHIVKGLNLFLALWGAGTLIALVRLAFGFSFIARFRRGLALIKDPRIKQLILDLGRRYGLRPVPKVLASHLTGSPLTLGLARPCVVLPDCLADSLDDDELRAVMAHEFAHVAHGDFRIGNLQRLAAAMYWWNPLVHAVNTDLTAAMEDVCDNHAIHEARESRRYAECLVHLAEKTCRVSRMPGMVGIRPPRKTLEERVKSLLSEDRDMKTSMSRTAAWILIACCTLATGFAAAARVAFTQDEAKKMKPVVLKAEYQEETGESGQESQEVGKSQKRRIQGGKATQKAVEWALNWLRRHQNPEGYWDCDGFDLQCKETRCSGKGMALNDVGATGLALLAFLGAGNTPLEGPYKEVVRNGIKYLCDVQDPEDGCLTPKSSTQYMYNHGVAALALVEAYGLSQWAPLKKFAKQAVGFIHESKNPGKAWRYNIGAVDPIEQNDVSVTSWMVMSLVSALDFGLITETKDLDDALMYIDEMTDYTTGRTGYKERGSYSAREAGDELIWPFDSVEAMTAAGMLCRIFGGTVLGKLDAQRPMLEKGAALLREKPPKWDTGAIDYYYWYYGTYAMFQMGGDDWKTWKDHMVKAVVEHQGAEGCEKGSWPPQYGPWGDSGGRVYATALCALCLEAFYRYENIVLSQRRAEEAETGGEPQEEKQEKAEEKKIQRDVIGVHGAPGGSTAGLFKGKYRLRLTKPGGPRDQISIFWPAKHAVEQGLEWLKNHQDPGGFWDCDGFDLQCEGTRCDGKGMALNDVGVTGLALLAFLGNGCTIYEGPYAFHVKRGLDYLCAVQDPGDGCLTPKVSEHYMYNHGIAALALIEGYGLSGRQKLKEHAKKAVDFIHDTKNPGKAWRYNIGAADPVEANDMSVTAWMVMALTAARDFGLPHDEDDLADALKYIDDLTDVATGRTGYKQKGSYSSREAGDELIWPFHTVEALTGAGMLCRIFICSALGDMVSQTEALQKGAKLLMFRLPNWDPNAGTIDYHHWYYGSYALYQMAGEDWKIWRDHLVKALTENQRSDGHAKGSWDPQKDPWGDSGGRVYATALCTLTLEVFYRYDNILYAK